MMDLFQLYLNAIADLNTQQGGCLRPWQNFNAWVNNISTELFNELFADAEKSQLNDDKLNRAFLKSVNVPITSMPGKNFDMIPLPADYGHYSALRTFLPVDEKCGCLNKDYEIVDVNDKFKCKPYEDDVFKHIRDRLKGEYINEGSATKVDNSRWGAAAGHRLMGPTFKKPVVTESNGGIKICPRDIGIAVLDYFRLPVKAVFAYTTVPGTDAIQYNLAGSTQLDWPDIMQPEFLVRLKRRYASYTRNPQQYMEANNEKKEIK